MQNYFYFRRFKIIFLGRMNMSVHRVYMIKLPREINKDADIKKQFKIVWILIYSITLTFKIKNILYIIIILILRNINIRRTILE